MEEWQEILGEADVDRLIEILTDTSDEGQRLRSSSPFVGVLSPEERLEILAARAGTPASGCERLLKP